MRSPQIGEIYHEFYDCGDVKESRSFPCVYILFLLKPCCLVIVREVLLIFFFLFLRKLYSV